MSELKLGTTNKRLNDAALGEGVEEECPYRTGFKVRIRPAASFNPHWRKALRELRDKRKEGEPAIDAFDLFEDPEFLVDAVVVSMGPVANGDGKEVEYTREIGLQVLADPGHADVRDWIALQAQRYGKFYTEDVEADRGNSGSGSSSKRAGAKRSKKTTG